MVGRGEVSCTLKFESAKVSYQFLTNRISDGDWLSKVEWEFLSQSEAVFCSYTSHTSTQQPGTHKLAEVSCSNDESGGKVGVEVQTLL